MNYKTALNNPKNFKAITSLSIEEFQMLIPKFEEIVDDYFAKKTFSGKPRTRKYVPKKTNILPSIEDKLFFILIFMKNNILQELHAAHFDMTQDMCNKWIHILMPLCLKLLEEHIPTTKIEDVDFKETVAMDVTERGVQRDIYEQEVYFSGKKKRHTIKNLAIVSLFGIILFVSPTFEGTKHDKKIADMYKLPTKVPILVDLGFYGMQKDYLNMIMPHKKPIKAELTPEQIKENQKIASKRIVVEHVFGSVKINRIVKDVCRLTKAGCRDLVFFIACGLHNYKLKLKNNFCS